MLSLNNKRKKKEFFKNKISTSFKNIMDQTHSHKYGAGIVLFVVVVIIVILIAWAVSRDDDDKKHHRYHSRSSDDCDTESRYTDSRHYSSDSHSRKY